jgi:hypothetical protein
VRIFLNAQEKTTSSRRAIDEGRLERLQALQMVAVNMGQKARQGRWLTGMVAKEVNADARKLFDNAIEGRHDAGS